MPMQQQQQNYLFGSLILHFDIDGRVLASTHLDHGQMRIEVRILFLDGEDLVFGFVANSSNRGKKSLDMSLLAFRSSQILY